MSIKLLIDEISLLEMEMNNIEKKISERLTYDFTGLDVNHQKFGNGKIVDQESNKIQIKFVNENVKIFQVPSVFEHGFLSCTDSDAMKKIDELTVLENRKKEVSRIKFLKSHKLNEFINESKKKSKSKVRK